MGKDWFHNCVVSEIHPDIFILCAKCADVGVDLRVRENMSDGKDGVTTHDTYFHKRCFQAQHPFPNEFKRQFTNFRIVRLKRN